MPAGLASGPTNPTCSFRGSSGAGKPYSSELCSESFDRHTSFCKHLETYKMEKGASKSRKELRKEARKAKHTRRFQHQTSRKQKQCTPKLEKENVSLSPNCESLAIKQKHINSKEEGLCNEGLKVKKAKESRSKRSRTEFEDILVSNADRSSLGGEIPVAKKKKKISKKKKVPSALEKYMQMDQTNDGATADLDLARVKILGKKLKVKSGKLGGPDDGLDHLLDGIPVSIDFTEDETQEESQTKISKLVSHEGNESIFDDTVLSDEDIGEEYSNSEEMEEESMNMNGGTQGIEDESDSDGSAQSTPSENLRINSSLNDSNFKERSKDVCPAMKYVPPHLRTSLKQESSENAEVRRRIRGLLNRLSESNVESIAGEISVIFQTNGRSLATKLVSEEVLQSCCKGPRGNEQHAAVFAAFISGVAASVGMDFGAKFLASLASSFEEEYQNEDALGLRNLTMLLSFLYSFGLCSSDMIYDLLSILSNRMEELDVSIILNILKCCGMVLRSDDPSAMKEFVIGVQESVQKMRTTASEGKEARIGGKRMEFMLEIICDIKNNKKRLKDDSTVLNRLKKWLKKVRVDDVQLRGVKWSKLLSPDKKGQWWLSGDMDSIGKDDTTEIAGTIDAEVAEAQKMLKLAATQRMNTEARRLIFCIIMTGEDYLDAFEKILRLKLPGKQDREILRVIVDCCLQEKFFNKYYSLLAAKLCHHDKNHKYSLQYCVWDHFKLLEKMELQKLANLARFLAELIASFSLSLSVLKVVEFTDPATLTSKVVIHFRILFETLFMQNSDSDIWNIFTHIASPLELENLRVGLEIFIQHHLGKQGLSDNEGEFLGKKVKIASKIKVARKALANVAGIRL